MKKYQVTYIRKERMFMQNGLTRREALEFIKNYNVIHIKDEYGNIVYTSKDGWLN